MESEQEQLQRDQQNSQHQNSFPFAIASPVMQPCLNIMHEQEDGSVDNDHEMLQNIKYLHERYPLNEIFQVDRSQIDSFMKSNKLFHRIKYLFGLQGVQQNNQQGFLQDIDSQIFNTSFYENPNFVDLSKLFDNQDSPSQKHKVQLQNLTKKLSEIQSKAFSGISIHKTIGKAFYQHFQNFLCLRNSSKYFQNFQQSFQKLFFEFQNVKKCGPNLILMIYEFWMRMFRQFIREIWRHSQKYSLDMFKKNKSTDVNSQNRSDPSSTTSSQLGEKVEKEKRKPWTKQEIQILEKIIQSKAVFNAARLKDLSEEFDRTASSISSKIQKLNKLKKNNIEEEEDISTWKKIQFVLKVNPQGLSKEQVVKKIGEMYEMGEQQNWKKSVSQLLSSRKTIEKIKGSFRLADPASYLGYCSYETIKDKIIQCFLKSEDYENDLKGLTHIYLSLYGTEQGIDQSSFQKIKVIIAIDFKFQTVQTNLSKALNRYDKVFLRPNQKILYRLKQDNISQKNLCMDAESFMLS